LTRSFLDRVDEVGDRRYSADRRNILTDTSRRA